MTDKNDEIEFGIKQSGAIIDEYYKYSKLYYQMQSDTFADLDKKALSIITTSGIIISIIGFSLDKLIQYLDHPIILYINLVIFIISIIASVFALWPKKIDEITSTKDLINNTNNIVSIDEIKKKIIKRYSSTSLSYYQKNNWKGKYLKLSLAILSIGLVLLFMVIIFAGIRIMNAKNVTADEPSEIAMSIPPRNKMRDIERKMDVQNGDKIPKIINKNGAEPGDLPPSPIYMKATEGGVTWENNSKIKK